MRWPVTEVIEWVRRFEDGPPLELNIPQFSLYRLWESGNLSVVEGHRPYLLVTEGLSTRSAARGTLSVIHEWGKPLQITLED